MASEQLRNQVKIFPKDFSYPKGNWKVGCTPTMQSYLNSSTEIETAASLETSKLNIKKSFGITFSLGRPGNATGWESANLSVKAKVGENGKYHSQSINAEYLAIKTPKIKHIRSHFELDEEVNPIDEKIYFSLYDDTPQEKNGLVFFSATVDDGTDAAK